MRRSAIHESFGCNFRGGRPVYSYATTTALGSGPQGYCGWDATHLTCPSSQGIFSWRYR